MHREFNEFNSSIIDAENRPISYTSKPQSNVVFFCPNLQGKKAERISSNGE